MTIECQMDDSAHVQTIPAAYGIHRFWSPLSKRLLIGVVLGFVGVSQASAHAVLTQSIPANGSIVQDSPQQIVLEFSDSIFPVEIKLLDKDGLEVVVLANEESSNNSVRIDLDEELEPGTYLIQYRVVSSDSHPVAGSIAFAVQGDDGVTSLSPSTGSTSDKTTATSLLIASYSLTALHNLCLLLAAGGILSLAVMGASDQVARLLVYVTKTLAFAGVLLSVATVGVEGAKLLGSGLQGVSDMDAWILAGTVSVGASSAAATLGFIFVLAGAGIYRASRHRWMVLGIAGIVLLCASQAISGHPVAKDPQWLLISAIIIHILFISFWFGSLLPLYVTVRREPATDAASVIENFSRTASIAVGLLFIAGFAMSWVHVQKIENLWVSGYGLILTGKLLLFCLLLILALFNRNRFTPRLAADDLSTRTALTRSIASEFAIIAAIVTISGVLATTSPPSTSNALKGEKAEQTELAIQKDLLSDGYHGRLEWRAESLATSEVVFRLLNVSEGDDLPDKVRLELSLPDRDIRPIYYDLTLVHDGSYMSSIPSLTVSGRWLVRIDVLVDDFNKVKFETALEVP